MNLLLLKAKIVERNKTQSSLAKKRGCTLNSINRLLNGHAKMTIDDALFFCDELEIITDEEKCNIFLRDSSLKWDKGKI